MKSKDEKNITPAQAIAEMKAKYPNDVNIIDEKVVDARTEGGGTTEGGAASKRKEA